LNTGALSADCGLAFLGSLKHSAKLQQNKLLCVFKIKNRSAQNTQSGFSKIYNIFFRL